VNSAKFELPAPWYFDPISFQAIAVFFSPLQGVGVSLRKFIRLFRAGSLLPTVLLYFLKILVRIVGRFLLANAQGFHLLGCELGWFRYKRNEFWHRPSFKLSGLHRRTWCAKVTRILLIRPRQTAPWVSPSISTVLPIMLVMKSGPNTC